MCLGWGTNLPWVPGSHRAAGSSTWLQQCFPQEQDQHREGSDLLLLLLLLLGFGASRSENPALCSCTCCWCRERNTHCRAGVLSPTHPSGSPSAPLIPKFLPQVPAGRVAQLPQSPTALSRDLHLTQGINRWLCLVTTPSPSQEEAGEGFFL